MSKINCYRGKFPGEEICSRVSVLELRGDEMIENLIWAFFIAVPALLVVAAIVATIRSNREFQVEEE